MQVTMKKLVSIVVLIIVMVNVSFSQGLKKGNVIGLHIATINLNPDVTLNQFKEFYIKNVIPEFEKTYPDVKLYFISGIRGENQNSVGLIYFFESIKIRDKYFHADGSPTELGMTAQEKMKPTYEKLRTLETATLKYTDWLIE
jgi:hypothetical protein